MNKYIIFYKCEVLLIVKLTAFHYNKNIDKVILIKHIPDLLSITMLSCERRGYHVKD